MHIITLEQQLVSVLNSKNSEDFLIEQPYKYSSIFMSRVCPDPSNPRFMPAVIIEDKHAQQFINNKLTKQQLIEIYGAINKVIIGKSCIINCCKYGSVNWKKANVTIESILELAANVAVSEIIQVPTIYPINDTNYQILTGHRRFFALIYVKGTNGAEHFKVYEYKPLLPKTKQFQENASREDLPQYGKLLAFQDAMFEIETLNMSRKRSGNKAHTVKETANILGISMGTYDNYNVLVRYPSVINSYEQNHAKPFLFMKKLVLNIEQQYKQERQLRVLNIVDRNAINELIEDAINGGGTTSKPVTQFKFKKVESSDVLRLILSTNVMDTIKEVDWATLDWSDYKAVNLALDKMIGYLNEKCLTREMAETHDK